METKLMIKEKRKQFKHDRALLKEGSDGAAEEARLLYNLAKRNAKLVVWRKKFETAENSLVVFLQMEMKYSVLRNKWMDLTKMLLVINVFEIMLVSCHCLIAKSWKLGWNTTRGYSMLNLIGLLKHLMRFLLWLDLNLW